MTLQVEMTDEVDPSQTLVDLRKSLNSVEETLGPLVDRKWSETTSALGTLERAKMNVLVSYAIDDLIWVYLKMKGVDPSTHDVSAELERIRTYYGKVKAVEDPETRRGTQIDKEAAGRIINHSIPKKQRLATTSAAALARSQAEAAVNEQVGTSGRFRFIAKDGETERVSPDDEDDDDDDDDDAGDEAEELLEDLHRQIDASKGKMDVDDPDRRKRKRAEDLNK